MLNNKIVIVKGLFLLLPVLLSIAFFTLLERKILAAIQIRTGCSFVGVYGILQPFADALKLLTKEIIAPNHGNLITFILAPIISLVLSLMAWFVIPFYEGSFFSNLNLNLLFIFAVSTVSVYSILMSGWASNSKYAFFGALRECSQMISYEICIGLILLTLILYTGTFNLSSVVEKQVSSWFICALFPTFLLFFVSSLAETSRVPFDFPEAESELVSGYNVEYSAVTFVLFFLAEYCHIILTSSLVVLLFLGGWNAPFHLPLFSYLWFPIKVLLLILLFIVVRAVLPRFRYDNLMVLLWKSFLPLSFGYFILIFSLSFLLDLFPALEW